MTHWNGLIGVRAAVLGDDVRQAPRLSRQLGFTGLMFDAFSPSLAILELSGTGRREFSRLLSSQSQRFVGLTVDLGKKGFGPGADIDRLLAQFSKLLEAASALAASVVCVDIGPLPPAVQARPIKQKITTKQAGLILLPEMNAMQSAENDEPQPQRDPAFESLVDSALTALGAQADRFNMPIAFRSERAGYAALGRALDVARCSWFGIDLDPVAILCDEWKSDAIFSTLGPLIRHVRGRDANRGTGQRTQPATLGQGDSEWPRLLSDLSTGGYSDWMTIDALELADRISGAAAGLKYLRSL